MPFAAALEAASRASPGRRMRPVRERPVQRSPEFGASSPRAHVVTPAARGPGTPQNGHAWVLSASPIVAGAVLTFALERGAEGPRHCRDHPHGCRAIRLVTTCCAARRLVSAPQASGGRRPTAEPWSNGIEPPGSDREAGINGVPPHEAEPTRLAEQHESAKIRREEVAFLGCGDSVLEYSAVGPAVIGRTCCSFTRTM